MAIISLYDQLAQSISSDSDNDQDGPAAAMGDLDAALQQLQAKVPTGTLADAWKRCPLLPFETDIDAVSEDVLKQRAGSVRQAFSDDSTQILNNLKAWREKYLKGLKANSAINDLERFKGTVEALRAKARLLYIAANDNKMREAQRQQPEVSSRRAGGGRAGMRTAAAAEAAGGTERQQGHSQQLLMVVNHVGGQVTQPARACPAVARPWVLLSARSTRHICAHMCCPAGCCCCRCRRHVSAGAQQCFLGRLWAAGRHQVDQADVRHSRHKGGALPRSSCCCVGCCMHARHAHSSRQAAFSCAAASAAAPSGGSVTVGLRCDSWRFACSSCAPTATTAGRGKHTMLAAAAAATATTDILTVCYPFLLCWHGPAGASECLQAAE